MHSVEFGGAGYDDDAALVPVVGGCAGGEQTGHARPPSTFNYLKT
jgi:hypothetical protein